MATRRPRGSRFGSTALTVFTILLVAALLLVGIMLVKNGRVSVPFTDSTLMLTSAQSSEKTGGVDTVSIPISGEAIPAYTRITRDHLWNRKAQRLSVVRLPASQVKSQMIRDLGGIVGRVLSRDKASGYAFTEADFLPPGTRPGLAAGIPPGKRAMVVTPKEISGLHALNVGDRFDIIATTPSDGTSSTPRSGHQMFDGMKGVFASQRASLSAFEQSAKQPSVRVIVDNGVAVGPVRDGRSKTNSSVTRVTPAQKAMKEFVMAIAPSEVAPLAQAIHAGAKLACVPRSGRPDDSPESTSADYGFPAPRNDADVPEDLHLVERISGRNRAVIPVPASKPADRNSRATRRRPMRQ